jgi:hypothetical protein
MSYRILQEDVVWNERFKTLSAAQNFVEKKWDSYFDYNNPAVIVQEISTTKAKPTPIKWVKM